MISPESSESEMWRVPATGSAVLDLSFVANEVSVVAFFVDGAIKVYCNYLTKHPPGNFCVNRHRRHCSWSFDSDDCVLCFKNRWIDRSWVF